MATIGLTLRVEDLSVQFGGLRAVDGVTLDLPSGQVLGLIGPNGAGKTTLFNAISGFVRPTHGSITLGDQEITRTRPARRVQSGIVRTFQHIGLLHETTVIANAVMAQHSLMKTGLVPSLFGLGGVEERAMRDRAMEALTTLQIDEHAMTPVRDLGHGLRKLAELACALVREPRVLLLDEPSAGLDMQETERLGERLAGLQEQGGFSMLVVDHDMRLVRRVAHHVAVLSFGRLIADGTWEDIRSDPEVVKAYLGSDA